MQTANHALGTNKPGINVVLEPTQMTQNVPRSIKSLFLSQKLTVPIKYNTFFKMPMSIITKSLTSPQHKIFSVEKKSKEAEFTKNPNYPKYM